jgi:sugar O-acyltransferase (sialic acid O-acetyltransferase NeuD family)
VPAVDENPLPLVIFGIGQIADVARVYVEQAGHRVVAFTVDQGFITSDTHDGLPVLNWSALETEAPPDAVRLFCPISYQQVNNLRKTKYLDGKARGYRFISFIHPSCWNNAQSIGENCFILENNILQPYSRIGDNVVLWSGNHIGHHSTIGDHCFLASHAVVSGGVKIGPRCFIGVNAAIADNRVLGEGVVVGAGALVLRDVPDEGVVAARGTEMSNVPSSRLRGL